MILKCKQKLRKVPKGQEIVDGQHKKMKRQEAIKPVGKNGKFIC